MSISFIVEVLPGEPEFLTAICKEPLRVVNERNEVINSCPAPHAGWTQVSLEDLTSDISERPVDAYLGKEWVGSSEV